MLVLPVLILAAILVPTAIIHEVRKGPVQIVQQQHRANQQLVMAIRAQNNKLLADVQALLDRPTLSIQTIRRATTRRGVRTVVVTRTITKQASPRVITKVVTKIVYRTKIVYICRLPNGHACKTA